MNILKTTFLLTCLTLLLVAMGSAIGGKSGAIIAFVIAGGMNFFSYWFSDKIVLKMYGAREMTEAEQPAFVGMVRRLALQAEHADAARLPHPLRQPERLRHRSQSGACRRRRHRGDHAPALAGRARRGNGPRTGPCAATATL